MEAATFGVTFNITKKYSDGRIRFIGSHTELIEIEQIENYAREIDSLVEDFRISGLSDWERKHYVSLEYGKEYLSISVAAIVKL